MNHEPEYRHTSYLSKGIRVEELKKTIRLAVKNLKGLDFDAIAFRGLSGSLVAPVLALKLGKTMIAVRKPNEKTHSGYPTEGDAATVRYLILDDLIDTGSTVKLIKKAIREFSPKSRCIGVYEYNPWGAQPRFTDGYAD